MPASRRFFLLPKDLPPRSLVCSLHPGGLTPPFLEEVRTRSHPALPLPRAVLAALRVRVGVPGAWRLLIPPKVTVADTPPDGPRALWLPAPCSPLHPPAFPSACRPIETITRDPGPLSVSRLLRCSPPHHSYIRRLLSSPPSARPAHPAEGVNFALAEPAMLPAVPSCLSSQA